MRHINQAGIDLIKEFEGLSLKAYQCSAGVWTIGYGHTLGVKKGDSCTTMDAELWLSEDLRFAETAVERFVKVPLTDNEFAALVSFVYNMGVGNFEKSTLLKLLNQGWYEQVPAQLFRWNLAGGQVLGGLARRRSAESKLWNTGERK